MALEGTTDNVSASTGASSSGSISSGTASEAMIKAAMAASSAESASGTGQPAGTGDTTQQTGDGTSGADAGTTAPPAAATGTPDATGNRGPIPFDRHEAALKNAREQFKWAQELTGQGYSPEDVKTAVTLLARLRGDAKGFWQQLGSELGSAGKAGNTEEVEEAYPEADLVSQDGKLKAFSADALMKALAVQEKRLLKKFESNIQPLTKFYSDQMTAQQQAEQQEQLRQSTAVLLEQARALPHFKENEQAIKENLKAMDVSLRRQLGAGASLMLAYNQFLASRQPALQAQTEQKVRDDFSRKANAAAGSISPSGGSGDPRPAKLENARDLAAHMEKLAASMSQ